MSHFAVLVIGDDVDGQLAPYHEFECTGWNNEYVQDIDKTEKYLGKYENYKSNYERVTSFLKDYYGIEIVLYGQEPDLEGDHKYGYAIVDENENIVKVVNRTNPNAKWDWYLIGGRWTGFFKLKDINIEHKIGKPGIMTVPAKVGYADQARKRDIDFEAMRNEVEQEAIDKWNQFHSVVDEYLSTFVKWNVVREEMFPGDLDAARDFYNNQAAKKVLSETKDHMWTLLLNFEEYLVSREEYAENARNSAIITFAVVDKGEWYERGDMGWWGMVANEKDNDSWNREFSKLLDSVSDDTLLTVVDCHI